MTSKPPRAALAGAFLSALLGWAAPAAAQSNPYSSVPVVLGTSGYQLNFTVTWTCDDNPRATTSFPGRIDLIDGGGNLAAELTATAGPGGPSYTATCGVVSDLLATINLYGAAGTPADGHLRGSWTIEGLSPGRYSLRFWSLVETAPGQSASAITSLALDAGGEGTLGPAAPTPTPTPAPPPTVTVSAPTSVTVLQGFTIATIASEAAGGSPLASLVIQDSVDNGATWSQVYSSASLSSPVDKVSPPAVFAAIGSAVIRATVTDTAGNTASASQNVTIGKASQGSIQVTPPTLTLVAGQNAAFTASGGATGNYAWSGLASGSGPTQTVTFPTAGSYLVTVLDAGNSQYSPSPAAAAAVTVQPAFDVLTISTTGEGSATGAGSYAPNSEAVAVATPSPGYTFAGWSGDASGSGPRLTLAMTGNKALTANFSALLSQQLSYVAPGPVSTRSAPFGLSVSASSGLPVTLILDSGPVGLAGTTLTPTGAAGEVTLTATQPGNSQYLPAPPLVIVFSIGPPPPGVLFSDDSAATRRSDRTTRNTSYTSAAEH